MLPGVAGLLERLGIRRRASTFVDRIGILRPLRVRDFALLWTGLTISFIGDGIYIIAIAWQTYDLSNSPSSLAAVGVAWSLPQVVLVLASGVLSDRLDRRHLMIAGDVIRGIAIGTIGFLSIVDALTLPILIVLVVVYGAGQAIFAPAFSSIVPTIVPLVGGTLVASIGPGWAFVADSGTFVFSAVVIFAMRTRHVPRSEEERTSPWADLVEGLRYVRGRTWLWVSMVAATVSLLATWGPWEVLVPFVVRNDLNGSAAALGLVYGAGGVGAVTAAIVLGQRGRIPRRAVTVLYVAWTVGMAATAGFGIATSVWQAMLVALVAETSITILIVIWYTPVQRLVPAHLLGRVSSLDWMISIAGVPLSFAIVGPAADAFGVDATLIAAGLLGGALTLAFMFYPGARAPERDGSLEVVPVEPEGAPVTT